jgi:nitrate reductase NapE component
MEIFILITWWFCLAWLGAEMAKSRNRNPTLWGILFVLFSIFAIIAMAIVGTRKE